MKKRLLFTSATFISMACNHAQDSTAKKAQSAIEVAGVKITGSVDVYHRYNFSNPKTRFTNQYTSFTNSQNYFELEMESLQAAHNFSKATAFADLGFVEEMKNSITIMAKKVQTKMPYLKRTMAALLKPPLPES